MGDDKMVSAEEARGLRENATPGPWRAVVNDQGDYNAPGIEGADGGVVLYDAGTMGVADRRLATSAPDLVRTVIARTEERDAAIARAEKAERERDEARSHAHDLDGVAHRLREERDEWKRECGPLLDRLTGSPCLCGSPEDYAVELLAERDRLARILACERGDDAQAPEGWVYVLSDGWDHEAPETWVHEDDWLKVSRGDSGDEPQRGSPWMLWRGQGIGWSCAPDERFATALEAMEAAEAPREGPGD